jgi:signal transduction histidine kinase
LRVSGDQFPQSGKLEAIGRLACEIAHDFNNLVCVIIGYSNLVLTALGKDHQVAKDMEEIKKSGERAASLTRQLLVFSRQETSTPRALNLNVVVVELHGMLQRLIRGNIEIVLALDPQLGFAHADSGQIEQVVLNLVLNARDAMPDGGKVLIETANVDLGAGFAERHSGVQQGRHVMLAVRDTGCGIGAGTLPYVFDPFFTTKERGHGTGLGLATVRKIIKQNAGHIEIDTKVGAGTTFRLYFPRVEATVAAVESAASCVRPITGHMLGPVVENEEQSHMAIPTLEGTSQAHAA